MSAMIVPHTPSPKPAAAALPESDPAINERTNPPSSPKAVVELTPPPSAQIRKTMANHSHSSSRPNPLASPPTTLKAAPALKQNSLFGEIPSVDSVQNFNEEQLRGLVSDLLPALTEARMSAAHSRLQHHLLTIETSEFSKRAEVEHDLTRREVQVLQEGQAHRGVSASPRSPQSPSRRHLDLALKRCNELQNQNAILEQRLVRAKKAITKLDEKNFELRDDVQRLRQRIKQNREHLDEMRSSGTISINGTPLTEYRTPLHRTPRTPATARSIHHSASANHGSQNAFDALVIAGEVMSGEANSVPSTPTRPSVKRLQHSHIRGAHSLSSLPSTPNRSRPITAHSNVVTPVTRGDRDLLLGLSAPNTQLTYDEAERHQSSRDSTISASDKDDAYDDYSILASQASQQAASMLRRDNVATTDRYEKSAASNPMKISGRITKAGHSKSGPPKKRAADGIAYVESPRSAKRAKTGGSSQEKVGLGIQNW